MLGWHKIRVEAGVAGLHRRFWLAGLFLAGMAVDAILHARRFGRSTLALDTTPARLGGWLSGVVRAPLPVQDAELQVTVECVQTTHHSSSSSGSSTSSWTLWRTTKLPRRHALPAAGAARRDPVRRAPALQRRGHPRQNADLLASVLGSSEVDLVGEDMDWYVAVTGQLRGVDYSDRFAVPVAPAEGAPAARARRGRCRS